jgi:hypothetical protein
MTDIGKYNYSEGRKCEKMMTIVTENQVKMTLYVYVYVYNVRKEGRKEGLPTHSDSRSGGSLI